MNSHSINYTDGSIWCLHNPKTQQSVALGGSIDYELVVRNTGTQPDDFTITSSDVSKIGHRAI